MPTYATTDLHGNYDLWKAIQNFLKPNDILIFLGDAIDRGDRGFEIFKELMEDSRVIYLRGNHEQMMYDALTSTGVDRIDAWRDWTHPDNGGRFTYKNLCELNLAGDVSKSLINSINNLPFFYEYINSSGLKLYLCHAGASYEIIGKKQLAAADKDKLIWDRTHLSQPWTDNKDYASTIVVHGHTPIFNVKYFAPDVENSFHPLLYANGHKINLDAGTPYTDTAFLLDLDTIQYYTFYQPKEEINVRS